ncbi:MAG TPA: hypothetical protein VN461_14470 [Vicinamibacteria bacterium]|jgi:hypothetical protein|nr:hypothetical protein [Vicinamibacteria bacterium]
MRRHIGVLAPGLLLAVSCGPFFPTPIRSILDTPAKYEGTTVLISGEVEESVNVLVLKYYLIRDDSGKIPVVTSGAVPRRGARVSVRGVVRQAFAIGDNSLTVLIEKP